MTCSALQLNHGDFLTPKVERSDVLKKRNGTEAAINMLLTPSSAQNVGNAPTKKFLPGAKAEFESLTASNLLPIIKDVDMECKDMF